MLSLLVAVALAQEPAAPTVTTAADGSVVAKTSIAATPEAVRAALADPVLCGTLAPEVLEVTATPLPGRSECTMVDVATRGLWDPLRYRALRCPTADGWRYDLVSSEDLTSMHAEWKVTAGENGTSLVEYTVHTEVHLTGVPDSMVHQGMVKSAKDTLVRLVERVVP